MGTLGNRSELEGLNGGIGDTAVAPKVTLAARLGRYVRAVRDGDEAMVEQTIVQLSQSRRLFAPLAFMVSGIGTLLEIRSPERPRIRQARRRRLDRDLRMYGFR